MHYPLIFPVLDYYGAPLLLLFIILLFSLETLRQLRQRTASRVIRGLRNVSLAAVGFTMVRLVLIPAMVMLATWTQSSNFGILNWLGLHGWIAFAVGFLLLDYVNYLWHRLNHQIPFLWRFHNVHHTDLDLDVTTGIRFHFGEIVGSIFFRGGAVLLIGPFPLLVLVYEIIFEGCTAFHHSNWRLPLKLERLLMRLIVTPRMHGIHHSIIRRETNTNYSIIFNVWDRLHRTLLLNIRNEEIITGVPAYRSEKEQTVIKLLKMPFAKQRPWQFPDGSVPARDEIKDKGWPA